MHKTVIALAIAGMAAPAFADSNVTLYGSVDYGWVARSGRTGLTGAAALSKQEFASDITGQNALGFKGAEDLGNGTKVIFELEAGFLTDNGTNSLPAINNNGVGSSPGSGPIFRRHSFVGLTGSWGTLIGGRVDGARYGVSTRYDPFGGAGVANQSSLQVHASRADNAIAYVTPNVDGLYAVVAYTSQLVGQEAAGNNSDGRLWVIQPNYVVGPLSVTLNYEHLSVHNGQADASSPVGFDANPVLNIYVAGASYDFGVAKLMGYIEHLKFGGNAACVVVGGALCDQTSWLVGGVAPITEADNVKVSYVEYTDHSPQQNSCRKAGIGGQHFLSKRTNLFADFAAIWQRDKGACTIFMNGYASSADDGTGSNTSGVGTRGVDVGIQHRF
jgi:predicted porin